MPQSQACKSHAGYCRLIAPPFIMIPRGLSCRELELLRALWESSDCIKPLRADIFVALTQ